MHTLGCPRVPSTKVTQTMKDIHETTYNGLMEKVIERDNMRRALRRVEVNDGAPGIDGVTTEMLRAHIRQEWESTKAKLLDGTYKPQLVRRFEIPKADGGMRSLGIPTTMDRLIQQAVLQILTPIYDSQFSSNSYGFRPNKSAHQAVKVARNYIEQGYSYVVDIDLEKFFDKINHDILMSKLAKKIEDKRILKLIRNYLQAGVMENGCCVATVEGTPQGGPLSPLLANILLHELDIELEKRGHKFVRYADDCNTYVKSKRAGERVMQSVKKFVEQRLKLKVNESKSAVDRPSKRKLLGFSYVKAKKVLIRISSKSFERVKDKIRELTRRRWGISMKRRIEELNQYLMGWLGYFHIASMRERLDDLNKWMRRRLRACLLNQWKTPKTRIREMRKHGSTKSWALTIGKSGKGLWRLAKTHQMNKPFGLAYWKNQGLIDLVEKYDVHRNTL